MARLKTKAGTRLDREKVDALSAEAEHGYNLDEAIPERMGPGRPSLERGLSPRISYRVGESLYLRAKRKAEREGRSVSELAREALESYLID
jgi:hypothetical protein